MNGLPYYKAYPRDFFEGTVGMDFEVKGAYRLVLDLIYMYSGRLPDDARFISGHLGCSVKKWFALRAALLESGKITLFGTHLGNYRADKVLDDAEMYRGKQRENGSRPKKNNGLTQAVAEPKPSHTDTDTDKSSEAKASGSFAADPAKAVFDAGVQVLAGGGVKPDAARRFVGKLRKDHPGRDGEILKAIMDCGRAGAVDPIPWITAAMRPPEQKRLFDLSNFGAEQ